MKCSRKGQREGKVFPGEGKRGDSHRAGVGESTWLLMGEERKEKSLKLATRIDVYFSSLFIGRSQWHDLS